MTTVEVMVTTPWLPEAVRLLRQNPALDAGVHLTLTSEWESIKWRPLTLAPSLTDDDGYFYPMIWPNDHYPADRALSGAPWRIDEVENELRAQIRLAKRKIPQLSHVTGHMGIGRIDSTIEVMVKRLASEFGLDIDPADYSVKNAGGYDGPRETPDQKIQSFTRRLEKLTPGTRLFVDHPGFDTEELRAVFHIGYENVALDREGVTRAWTSSRAKKIVRERNIELISYSTLAK